METPLQRRVKSHFIHPLSRTHSALALTSNSGETTLTFQSPLFRHFHLLLRMRERQREGRTEPFVRLSISGRLSPSNAMPDFHLPCLERERERGWNLLRHSIKRRWKVHIHLARSSRVSARENGDEMDGSWASERASSRSYGAFLSSPLCYHGKTKRQRRRRKEGKLGLRGAHMAEI